MRHIIVCGVKTKSNEIYSPAYSTEFQKSIRKLKKYRVSKILSAITDTIDMLCTESNMDILRTRLSFHQLRNFSITVDGVKYKNPYDIHVPVGGSNNNNDLVILFAYNHTEQQVVLLDIGSHKKLKIGGATNEIATVIYGRQR